MRASILFLGLLGLAIGCGDEVADFDREVLMDPQSEAFEQQAPEHYRVRFETTAGDFTVEVERQWAPLGADRFYHLVRHGYYHGQRFYRVVPGFVVQWGMHGDPELNAKWHEARLPDDPVKTSNVRGTLCFAAAREPNSRTTHVFVNLKDNAYLDGHRFAPFGRVIEGMETLEAINSEYGEQPDQQQIYARGNQYLQEHFPRLDYIKRTRLLD